MNYKQQILGPLFTATGGFLVAHSVDIITLNEALNGVTASGIITITIMLYKWSDVE